MYGQYGTVKFRDISACLDACIERGPVPMDATSTCLDAWIGYGAWPCVQDSFHSLAPSVRKNRPFLASLAGLMPYGACRRLKIRHDGTYTTNQTKFYHSLV
jgi:hypothetical protein